LKKNITLNKKNLFNINKLKYLPKWIVLLIDIFLVIFSGIITFLIFKELKLDYIHPDHFYSIIFFYLTLNVFFFLIFKTYSGIIRHTSQIDALKLFLSQFSTFGVIVVIDYFLLYLGKYIILIISWKISNTYYILEKF
jgi:FlaA1/EpsC-like NDP-sugar epimerase